MMTPKNILDNGLSFYHKTSLNSIIIESNVTIKTEGIKYILLIAQYCEYYG